MSYILDALKRAEQKARRKSISERREPEPPLSGSAADSPVWDVKMVSPNRYVRINVKAGRKDDLSSRRRELWERIAREVGSDTVPDFPPPTEEAPSRGLFTARRVAVVSLALLLLLAGATAANVWLWLRPASVTTDVNKLTHTTRPERGLDLVKPEGSPGRDAFQVPRWSGPVTLKGEIAHGLNIEMKLVREGSKLLGSYYYERIGKDISVRGAIDEAGSIVLDEFVKGHKTGIFTGKFVSDARMEGKWSKPGSTRSRHFFLVSESLLQKTPVSSEQRRTGQQQAEQILGKRDQEALAEAKSDTAKKFVDVLTVTFKSDYLFAVNSSALLPGAYDELERVLEVLKQYPETSIRIAGHTDSIGSADSNRKFSERRAEAVKNALVGMGVNPSRLTAVGYGARKPIASNKTEAGRQQNRRVEVRIVPKPA
jgi:outer membrane protein OmpA-like peptidoglycan-associated protein